MGCFIKKNIMLVFTGDINLTDNNFDVGYGVGSSIRKGLNPFSKILKKENEYWIGNFEGVTSNVSDITSYAKDCFRIEPSAIKDFKLIDCYGLANNHVMEHGVKAYHEMDRSLKSMGLSTFGSLQNKSYQFLHEGKKVGISGFSLRNDQLKFKPEYWNFPEYSNIVEEFNNIISNDYKIAYIHWGVEFIDHPMVNQIRFAHWLVDLGYDLIIGMHPHVLQGFEVYKGKYIFYSLGNFVFNMAWEKSKYGAIVKLNVNNGAVEYDYIKIDKSFSPKVVNSEKVPVELHFETLNQKVANIENPEPYIEKAKHGLKAYRNANYISILKNAHKSDFSFTIAILKDFIRRRFK